MGRFEISGRSGSSPGHIFDEEIAAGIAGGVEAGEKDGLSGSDVVAGNEAGPYELRQLRGTEILIEQAIEAIVRVLFVRDAI